MDIHIIVEKAGDGNFGCFQAKGDEIDMGLTGAGKTAREAIADVYAAYELVKATRAEEGENVPAVDFFFQFDVGSLFDYYPLNVTAFANYIGMNASLLRQYVSGAKTPQAKSLLKIKDGLRKLSDTLDCGRLIEKPAVQYA